MQAVTVAGRWRHQVSPVLCRVSELSGGSGSVVVTSGPCCPPPGLSQGAGPAPETINPAAAHPAPSAGRPAAPESEILRELRGKGEQKSCHLCIVYLLFGVSCRGVISALAPGSQISHALWIMGRYSPCSINYLYIKYFILFILCIINAAFSSSYRIRFFFLKWKTPC